MTVLDSQTLERATIHDGQLEFVTDGGIGKALDDELFRLAVPAELDLGPGIRFAREFWTEPAGTSTDRYRGFRSCPDVYFDRENFQTEHVLADRWGRKSTFPSAVAALAENMNALALVVLRATLQQIGIDPSLWSTVTGGAAEDRGTHWFASNHYRPEREQPGCAPHKDTGFVTVLYIEHTGLEAAVENDWVPIEPTSGEFLVNFGGSLELLTERLPTPVRAVLHRVRHTAPAPGAEHRFSFAAFINPPPSGDLYRMRTTEDAEAVQSVEEFLRDFNAKTWNDRHADFGIATGGGDIASRHTDEVVS